MAKIFREHPSRPCLCIRLVITDCPAIWRVKRSPKRAYASFRQFSCAIAHHFLGDPDFDVKNTKFFRGSPSRPCLCIRLAIMACPTHLGGQKSPKASICLISTIFVCYSTIFLVIQIPTSKMPYFYVDVRKDLFYAYGWPSRLVRPIWRIKRAPKRAYTSVR